MESQKKKLFRPFCCDKVSATYKNVSNFFYGKMTIVKIFDSKVSKILTLSPKKVGMNACGVCMVYLRAAARVYGVWKRMQLETRNQGLETRD